MPAKLHVKKGDLVKVISGDDKGQTGRVLQAFPRENKVIVEGINRVTKHTKVNYQGQRGAKQGGPETKEAPIHASNVKRVKDDKAEKPDKAEKTGTESKADKADKADKAEKTGKAEEKPEAGEDE